MIHVYSKPTGCSKCMLVHNVFAEADVSVKTIMVNDGVIEFLHELGFNSVPVVSPNGPLTVENKHEAIVGFDIDKLEKLIDETQSSHE